MKQAGALACLVLAACAGGGAWQKPGADTAAVSAAHADCRDAAAGAAQTERRIDEDIIASRGTDWERSRTFAAHRETMRAETAAHVEAVIDACMRAHGFTRPR